MASAGEPPARGSRAALPPARQAGAAEASQGPPNGRSPIGLNYFGPVATASGLGSAARGYVQAIRAAGLGLTVHPVRELFEHQASVPWPPEGDGAVYPVSLAHINADVTDRFLYHYGAPFRAARYRIGFWVWELAAFRPDWIPAMDLYDEIWVPSTFCQRSLHACTRKPVQVMPHVVAPCDAPGGSDKAHFGVAPDAFVFLVVFDASSYGERKNPLMMVEAFREVFGDDPGVVLLVKMSYAVSDPGLRRRVLAHAASTPNIQVIDRVMTPEELAQLQRSADCYVSPHRSEGFGLTIAEAMAWGKPVIATNYGGSTDFVDADSGFPLDYRLVEIEQDIGPYPKGYVWAEPSQEHLQALLRQVRADPQAAARVALAGQQRVRSRYSAQAIGGRIARRLAEIGA